MSCRKLRIFIDWLGSSIYVLHVAVVKCCHLIICDHVEVSWNLGTMGPLNHPFKYVFRCNKASRKPGVALWIGKPLHWLISVPYIGSLVFTIHHQLSLTINPYSPYFAWHVAVTIICLNQSFQETSIRGRKLLPPSRASIDESSEMELQQVGLRRWRRWELAGKWPTWWIIPLSK